MIFTPFSKENSFRGRACDADLTALGKAALAVRARRVWRGLQPARKAGEASGPGARS